MDVNGKIKSWEEDDLLNNSTNLNPRLTFDSFVVGASNRFAHAACMAVASLSPKRYNPLFIYSGVGLGKTHLINAIGLKILKDNPPAKVCLVTCEDFTNELIESIQYERMTHFRQKYRSMDILLIDDIQSVSRMEQTQEEFFHTFNTLHQSQRQIVITSDKVPKDMPGIEERLRSRFEWGLIADIQPPELETRVAILQKKAQIDSINLPYEVAMYIASNVNTNIRELESVLSNLDLLSTHLSKPVSIELCKNFLDSKIRSSSPPSIENIIKNVSSFFNLKPSDIRSARRTKSLVLPRQIAMYLSRILSGTSYPDIGSQFGGKNHTTVMHACKKIDDIVKNSPKVSEMIDQIKNNIRSLN